MSEAIQVVDLATNVVIVLLFLRYLAKRDEILVKLTTVVAGLQALIHTKGCDNGET